MLLKELLRPAAPAAIRMYRDELAAMLGEVFPSLPLQVQWAEAIQADVRHSPRVDVAVGPFSDSTCNRGFDELIRSKFGLINALFHSHRSNLRNHRVPDDHFSFQDFCTGNPNARCFLAIDMETGTSGKHLIGASVNVAALGRIGIVVAWTGVQLQALISVRSYLLHLNGAGGNPASLSNLLLLTAQQVEACVRQQRSKRSYPPSAAA